MVVVKRGNTRFTRGIGRCGVLIGIEDRQLFCNIFAYQPKSIFESANLLTCLGRRCVCVCIRTVGNVIPSKMGR